jgi:hypothetical protein
MKYLTLRNIVVTAILAIVGSLVVLTAATVGQQSEIKPAFNAFDNVDGQGNEADFVRVRNPGTTQAFGNSVTNACTDGQEISIQVYIHNSSSQAYNGTNFDGPVVAKDAKLSLTKSSNKEVQGVVGASNADSVIDSASITCNGTAVDFDFIPGSAIQTNSKGNLPLNDNVFSTTGTAFGFESANGVLPACWEYITIVYAKVIVDVPEVVEKIPAVCDLLKLTIETGRKVTVRDIQYTTNDATVNNLSIDFGNGVTKTLAANKSDLPYSYQYPKSGEFKVVASLNTTFEGQTKVETSTLCAVPVTITEEAKPTYSCDMFQIVTANRTVTVRFLPTAVNGATFKDATIVYTADNKTRETVTTNSLNADGKVENSYTFVEGDRNIFAKATVRFNVNNDVKEVVCEGSAVLAAVTTPTVLPNTGAGSFAGLLAAVTVAGAVAHRTFVLKRI